MADKYKGWVVDNAHKPAFRQLYLGTFDCHDINALKKDALLEIALDFDRRNYPLSLSDTDIKDKVSEAQTTELQQEVKRQVEIQKKKDEEKKAGAAKKRRGQEDVAAPIDGKAADQDQDGDVRMAEDEDTAEVAPRIDPTAEAVPSPVDDNRKRKRTDTVSSFDTERAGTVRPKTSLIVKLKLRGSARVGTRGMQTTTQVSKTECDMITALANNNAQGLGVHQGQNQVAEDTRPVKARRLVDKPGSRLQHGLARPPALARSTESGKKDSDSAVAGRLGDVFGTAAPANTLEQLPLRRQPQRKNRIKTYMPVEGEAAAVDGTLDDSKHLAEGGVASDASSAVSDRKRNPDKDTETNVAEKGFPRDVIGNYKSFPWSG